MELVRGGKEVKVTNSTRKEYAHRVARFHLLKEVNTETKEFIKGFCQVIPRSIIQVFDADELDLIMSGTPEISI